MASLVKQIENYINRLLDLSEHNCIEIQRADLAKIFMCVPSQINYVLSTRFNEANGYYIETRRGGGGYVRIMRVGLPADEDMHALLDKAKEKQVGQTEAERLLQRLYHEGLLTKREAEMLKAVLTKENLQLPEEQETALRGRALRMVLITLLREDLEENT